MFDVRLVSLYHTFCQFSVQDFDMFLLMLIIHVLIDACKIAGFAVSAKSLHVDRLTKGYMYVTVLVCLLYLKAELGGFCLLKGVCIIAELLNFVNDTVTLL